MHFIHIDMLLIGFGVAMKLIFDLVISVWLSEESYFKEACCLGLSSAW